MLCDECRERPANVHVTKTINDQRTERHLCEVCAQKSGEMSFHVSANVAIEDILAGVFNPGAAPRSSSKGDGVCHNCGMTYGEFCQQGRLGCGQCVAVYGDRLRPLLRRIHGVNAHSGKVPKRTGEKLVLRQRVRELRQELDRLVACEEYEQAAKIRDEIRTLEKESNS